MWKSGLRHVFKALDCAMLPHDIIVMGGGTALMHFLNHRVSKDIDIFLDDPQYINFFLPSLNGYLESISHDYRHLPNFVKIKLEKHEIDFILAKNITGMKPEIENVDGFDVPMDHPFETIAKKIFYRHDSFTVRDIFDLAAVYNNDASLIDALAAIDEDTLDSLGRRIESLADGDMIYVQLDAIQKLPGAKGMEQREMELCRKFLDEIKFERSHHRQKIAANAKKSRIRPKL